MAHSDDQNDEIIDYDDEAFQRLVARDIRGNTTEGEAEWLRSDEIVDEWRDELLGLINDVDAQLAEKKGKLEQDRARCLSAGARRELYELEAEFNVWRGKTLRWKKYALERYREAKGLAKDKAIRDGTDESNGLAARLQELEQRVKQLEAGRAA